MRAAQGRHAAAGERVVVGDLLGSLITIVSVFILILIGHWIENFIRSHSGSAADCEHE